MITYPHTQPATRGQRPSGARRRPARTAPYARPAPATLRAERTAAIGQLAASIAHEVDQPLAAIALHAQAALRCIERAAAPGAPAQPGHDGAQAALRALLAASTQASDIVSSMRSLAGHAQPIRVRCRLDEAVAEVLATHAHDIERLGIDCATRFGRGARSALAHPVQLRQLLRNLVSNAIDALRGVGGRPRRLRIEARLDAGGGLRLTVRDNGAGIDAALARRVFEPLVSTKATGLGLGLAICRAIADAHGGRIWAEPLAPHGCQFTCLLPLAAPLAAQATAASATPATAVATEREVQHG